MRLKLLPCLLLAACASHTQTPQEAACREKAFHEPAVEAATERANSTLQEVRMEWLRRQKQAFERAYTACLEGPSAGGGVEPVQQE